MDSDLEGARAVLEKFRFLGQNDDAIALHVLEFCGRGHFEKAVEENELSLFLERSLSKRKFTLSSSMVSSSSSSASGSDNESREFDAPPPVRKRTRTRPIGALAGDNDKEWVLSNENRGARVSLN